MAEIMPKRTVRLFLVAGLLWPLSLMAELPPSLDNRPKIGLVLSGGGARGAAHIGVIRRLEELQVPIDYIAGTSMGSIVGGLYASGLSVDEIEKILTSIEWNDAFIDESKREDKTFRRKTDDRLYLFDAKPGLTDDLEIKFPGGVFHGQKIDLILNKYTKHVATVDNFDELPIPYRAVAVNIATGEEVVLGKGSLGRAMRASMNIPTAFAPVMIDGVALADGGMANNLPISVARDMGADLVIAVDISTPLYSEEELTNVFKITGQLTGFLTRKNTEEQIATLTENDVLIVPKLGDIGSGDFQEASKAVPIGYEAADAKSAEIKKLSEPSTFTALKVARPKPDDAPTVISFIRLDNQSRVDDEVIMSRVTIKEGEALDTAELEENISKIYGLDLFQNVFYQVVQEDEQPGVIITAQKKSWGPNYIQFGLSTSNNFDGDSRFNIGAAYTRHTINDLDGEWRTALQLGEDPLIITELYQPLNPEMTYFAHGGIGIEQRNVNIFSDIDEQLAEYQLSRGLLFLALGRNFDTWGELRFQYRYEDGDAEVRVGDPALQDFNFKNASFMSRFSIDTLDNINFPKEGYYASLELNNYRESLGGDEDYDQVEFQTLGAKTWGKNTLFGKVELRSTLDDDAPFQSLFRTGGFTDLSGFNENELSGQHTGLLSIGYLREIEDIFFLQAYLGGTLEYGGYWQDKDDIFDDNIFAGSVFIGLDTPIGPFYTGLGMAEGGNRSLYFYLGKLF
jgi:NTE family protein